MIPFSKSVTTQFWRVRSCLSRSCPVLLGGEAEAPCHARFGLLCQSRTAVIPVDLKHRVATGTFAACARRLVWVSNCYLSCAPDRTSKWFSPYINWVTQRLRWLPRWACWFVEVQFWESGSQIFILLRLLQEHLSSGTADTDIQQCSVLSAG